MTLTTTESKSMVSGVLIAASLALTASTAMAAPPHHKTADTTHVARTRRVAAQTVPQVMYKDIIRPNGQKRSAAEYQGDVNACYARTGGSPYVPDGPAMKKCLLSYGFQFVWERGFGSATGTAVASGSGSSDDDYAQQTLQNNNNAEQQAEEQNNWALQQQTMQNEQQSADMASEQASEMAASQAAADAQNALANDMTNQYMMNEVNSQ